MNDVLLNKRKVRRFMPVDESTHDDSAYTHEEIQQILLKCDERAPRDDSTDGLHWLENGST